jgi:hypothetical protein
MISPLERNAAFWREQELRRLPLSRGITRSECLYPDQDADLTAEDMIMATPIQLATGLGGAIGCDFRSSHNQLVFVEYAGKLSRLNLFHPATIVSSGTAVLKGTFSFDLETGVEGGFGPGMDIWWEQQTNVLRQIAPQNSAGLANLGVVDFATLNSASLQSLPYASTPIAGNNNATNKLVVGDVFAVRTSLGNYAKVKVLAYGYNLTIQWVTYHLDSGYAVLGTGYSQPEDVKVSADDTHAYVTERTGDLVRVALASANRAAATVVTAGMTAPQQLFLDEAHHSAYVVEYASPGHLWHVDLTTGSKTAITSSLTNAVGLVLTADLQLAYVSEQTTGPDQGRVSCIQMSSGSRTTLVTGLTSPFFLTWSDASQTTLLVAERDPANRITGINVTSAVPNLVAGGVPSRPSSVAVPSPGDLLICSDQVIEEVDFASSGLQPAGPLLMGIGFIPFDKVKPSGLADTTVDPTYFYQVQNVPFGGTLPLMVNHLRAFNDGAAYYRVLVDSVVRNDTWTDEKWNGFQYVAQTTGPTIVAGQPGYYPVHPLSELFLWMNPSLGSLMSSTNLTNNTKHQIVLEFVNGAGTLIEKSTLLTIMVDNEPCAATIGQPSLLGATADNACGLLHYAAKNSDLVSLPFTASHPHNYATYSISLIKGVNTLTLPAGSHTGGPVPESWTNTDTVADMLGTCNVAGFAEYLYVAATINNGWGRQSQYDASAAIEFVLAPP